MPLSDWDDYLIHQISEPIETVGTDSPHFMDRLWFMAYTEDGSLQMMAGLGVYPNNGVMDGFLIVRHENIQRNIRLSRHVGADRFTPAIDALSFDVIEPQKRWSINLAANDHGIGCSLDFKGRVPPFLFPRLGFADQEQLHYKQPGRCSGNIIFEDRKFDLVEVPSVRDRSWGFRKPGIISGIGLMIVVEAHFETCSATLIYVDTVGEDFKMRDGAILGDDGSVAKIVAMKQHVNFEPGSRMYKDLELSLGDADGTSRRLVAKTISDPCYFTGGGYGGQHGLDRGPLNIEGERWDVAHDSDVGGVFPYYSRIAEFELDGAAGIGHIEAFVSQDADWIYGSTL